MIDTILLTGTIKVVGQTDHHIRSTTDRLFQYITNITKYIIDSPFQNIIFCENSNYDIKKERKFIEELAIFFGKKVELLQFQGDTYKTNEQGRGYGESEIMEYALIYSKLLPDTVPFVKITGRYYLTNAYQFVQKNTQTHMFVRMIPFQKLVSTACYVTTPGFYRTHLGGIGTQVDDKKGREYQLEGIFYKKLSTLRSHYTSFRHLPHFQAITGSGYSLHTNHRVDTLKGLLLYLGFYSI